MAVRSLPAGVKEIVRVSEEVVEDSVRTRSGSEEPDWGPLVVWVGSPQ